MIHDLNVEHKYFKDIISRLKTFVISKNDSCYTVGDRLILHEIVYVGEEMNELEYTRRNHTVIVKHILNGPVLGLMDGWVIMSIG